MGDVLASEVVAAGSQLLVSTEMYHRDPQHHRDPDRFRPERFESDLARHFLHLSGGTQVCPGRNLALFIGTAVSANILKRWRCELVKPKIGPGTKMPYALNPFRVRLRVSRSTG